VSHAKRLVGLDTSQAMTAQFNSKAEKAGVADKMHALCTDILGGEAENIPAEARDVDVVVCSLAYHHIEDATNTSKVLASLLKKGGHLLVLDLLESFPPL
jgi:ubiquinone/menaquinone biosynthesis C-methylase UbiE